MTTSETKRRRIKKDQRLYADSTGLFFHEAAPLLVKLYGEPRTWRPRRIIVSNASQIMHYRFAFRNVCWICGHHAAHGLQVHEIASGSRKSLELTNQIMVGGDFDCGCHAKIQSSPAWLKACFRAKWECDPETLSWLRLILLVGRLVPFDSLD